MSHALSAGADLVEATQCYRAWEIRYAFNTPFIKNVEDLISACQKHVVAATGSSPFKVGDNQRPERTMTGVRKPPPESSVPGDNLPGEVGGINCGGDMGVRRCLARSLTSLAPMRTPKSANGPRSNSFRPDSPSTTNFPRGRKTQPSPSPHRTWSVPDASSQPQLNLQFTVTVLVYENLRILSLFLPLLSCIMKMGYGQEKLMGC